MDFGLSEDQREIQRTARDMLAERCRPERVREHAEAGTADAELWRELGELGWTGIAVAEQNGGQGMGLIELAILCEELGRVTAPVPFLPTVLAATFIEHAGDDAQRERFLPGLATGELSGSVALAAGGVAALAVGAREADVFILLEGDSATLLAAADATLEQADSIDPTRSAARASGTGEVLPGPLGVARDRALVALAAEQVGVCDRALEMTVAYVKDRKQFGVPVGAFQAVSHRCAQMLLDTERARATTSYAAWAADSDVARLAEAAAMAAAVAGDAGRSVTASAIQAHGGIGFTWEADVHWLYKRAQVDAGLLGGAGAHRSRLAATLAPPMATPA